MMYVQYPELSRAEQLAGLDLGHSDIKTTMRDAHLELRAVSVRVRDVIQQARY